MMAGLLDSLLEPEVRAEIAERGRIVAIVAEQMGCSRREAADHLFYFEAVTSSDGHTLH
jgi:hypothetical protein